MLNLIESQPKDGGGQPIEWVYCAKYVAGSEYIMDIIAQTLHYTFRLSHMNSLFMVLVQHYKNNTKLFH